MCVVFWLLEALPKYKLLLALNRDEFFSRPRSLSITGSTRGPVGHGVEGGTCLAISESAHLAFVTNFRELNPNHEGAVHRGELPTSFLQSSKPPHEYLEGIAACAGDYNGFNLIVADVMAGDMAYLTNRPHDEPIEVKKVSTGLHCLSNANLDSPWPKALRGKEKPEALISQFPEDLIPEEHIIESLLSDSEKADYSHLPGTDLPLETACSESYLCVS